MGHRSHLWYKYIFAEMNLNSEIRRLKSLVYIYSISLPVSHRLGEVLQKCLKLICMKVEQLPGLLADSCGDDTSRHQHPHSSNINKGLRQG